MNKIFTFGYNRPDLLEKQYESFKKNTVGNFEFYLVYDHIDDTHTEEFGKVCSENQIGMYDHRRNVNFGPSGNHGSSLQWIYENFLEEDDRVLFLDHDIFLIHKFYIDSFFEMYDAFGPLSYNETIEYFWPGIFGFKFNEVKKYNLNLNPGVYNDRYLDTAGNTYLLVQEDSIKKKIFEKKYYYNDPPQFEVFDDKFIHLYAASKWHENFQVNQKDEDIKKSIFNIIDKEYLNSEIK